jgi:hypothetical protein
MTTPAAQEALEIFQDMLAEQSEVDGFNIPLQHRLADRVIVRLLEGLGHADLAALYARLQRCWWVGVERD